MSSRSAAPSSGRLAAYHPTLDRLIFIVALLGVLVVTHLWIQESRDFLGGCTGVEELQDASAFDCGSVVSSEAGTFLGVSNLVWGMLFYVTVALLSLAAVLGLGGGAQRPKQLRALVIAGAFVYTLYLVYYQYAVLGTFCKLCLASAALVTTLTVLQLIDFMQPTVQPKKTMQIKREVSLMAVLAVLVVVLAGADVMYFEAQDAEAAPAQAEAQPAPTPVQPEATPAPAPTAPATAAAQTDAALGACEYNAEIAAVADFEALVSISDPMQGDPNAPVQVIEFFDLNCPHCRTMHPVMKQVVEQNSAEARFYFVPFVIMQQSVIQTEALYDAAQQGLFFEMLDAQFANQRPSGLSVQQLQAIATEIGMDAELMTQRLQQGLYRNMILQRRQSIIDLGVPSVPTVFINGRAVKTESRSAACLKTMIAAAAAG